MATKRRRKPPVRTYVLALDGELEGVTVTMAPISGRDIIRIRSSAVDEAESLDILASHVIEHDFDVADVLDLDYRILLAIMTAWMTALNEGALPPGTGGS